MPVVTDGGLVGRVTAVSPLTAQVDLITRDKSGSGQWSARSATRTLSASSAARARKTLLEMRYVPGSVDVQVGQTVFTTGQDGIYPAGLKVGEIVEVVTGFGDDAASDTYPPERRLDSMQEVGVLLYEPPATHGVRTKTAERGEGDKGSKAK